MPLKFVTGNKNKFEEVRSMLGLPLEQVEIDLPELQHIDAKKIISHKIEAAEHFAKGEYLIEDTSLYLDCLGGKLPGPLIKWFLETLGTGGIVGLVEKYQNNKAEAVTIFGYADKEGRVNFFEGRLCGSIVSYRGNNDFGWGPIFQPEGSLKTFGEMDRAEKHAISMRAIALYKLRNFLTKHDIR